MRSSVGLHTVSHFKPQGLQKVIKKQKNKNKKDMPVTEILNTYTQQRNKHLVEIPCENKVLIKSYSA